MIEQKAELNEIQKKVKEFINESRQIIDSKSATILNILQSLKEENEQLISKCK